MTAVNMLALKNAILNDTNSLKLARKKAGKLVNGNTADMTNCCAATLSYLLIDCISIPLRPTTRALKLAFILEKELGFQIIGASDPILPGDVGVVDEPKSVHPGFIEDDDDDDLADGDSFDSERLEFSSSEKYKGDGYVENDPSNKNWHHIYLVLEPRPTAQNRDLLLIADNQAASPHLRDIKGGAKSATKYFLRAPT